MGALPPLRGPLLEGAVAQRMRRAAGGVSHINNNLPLYCPSGDEFQSNVLHPAPFIPQSIKKHSHPKMPVPFDLRCSYLGKSFTDLINIKSPASQLLKKSMRIL